MTTRDGIRLWALIVGVVFGGAGLACVGGGTAQAGVLLMYGKDPIPPLADDLARMGMAVTAIGGAVGGGWLGWKVVGRSTPPAGPDQDGRVAVPPTDSTPTGGRTSPPEPL